MLGFNPEDVFAAYLERHGFVGIGRIRTKALMIRDVTVGGKPYGQKSRGSTQQLMSARRSTASPRQSPTWSRHSVSQSERPWPDPSIEGTLSGLWPLRAPHSRTAWPEFALAAFRVRRQPITRDAAIEGATASLRPLISLHVKR
jgi:hypothetical protein